MFLFIFEGLGTSELLLILIVALVIFGPRKLPQLSRSLGKSLANFKRASEDFKQTWEKEVARESALKESLFGDPVLADEDRSILGESRHRTQAVLEASEEEDAKDGFTSAETASSSRATTDSSTIARGSATPPLAPAVSTDSTESRPTRKRDWL